MPAATHAVRRILILVISSQLAFEARSYRSARSMVFVRAVYRFGPCPFPCVDDLYVDLCSAPGNARKQGRSGAEEIRAD